MVKVTFGRKPGFIHILLILIILGAVSVAGYSAYKYKISKIFASGFPTGSVAAYPTSVANNNFVILTTKNAVGANAAQVESVRYFLLNPTLKAGNTYGNPDWCSNPDPCSQSSQATYITYDLGESSNPADDYKMVWDANTKSPNSAGRDRSLAPSNIPPGTYKVGIKVRDVNGNETGNASMAEITITEGTAPSPTPTPVPDLGLKFSTPYFGLKLAAGGVGLKAFDMTSTGATKYWLYIPTNSLGITFSPSEGNITPGQTIPIYVKADANQPFGIYTGTVSASSSYTNAQTPTGVTDSITVEPSTADSDKDGFVNLAENKMGLDPNYSCKTPFGINAWPPDVNNDGTINTVDSQAVFNAFSSKNYVARYDMNGDGVIGANDAQKVYSYIGKTCK